MSQATAALPQTPGRPEKTHPVRRLLPLPGARASGRPKTLSAVVAMGLLLAVVAAQLLLSVLVTQSSYQLEDLQASKTRLDRSEQAVSERLDTVSSPQSLAAKAQHLGMVPDGAPVYLRLSDGKVLGAPEAASGTAGSASLVPNALLAPKKPKTRGEHTGAKSGKGSGGAPASNGGKSASGPVAWSGALPSPATH